MGYGGRIMNSIKGILFGIVLFLVSFGVLYWNEGRADMSDVAKKATVIEASNVTANQAFDGLLVSATGTVTAEPMIGDDLYLKPGAYFAVERNVEVYSWVEQEETTTKTTTGGSSTSETTYTYVMEWADTPADSSNFHVPEGHTNAPASIDDLTKNVDEAMLEQYSFAPESVDAPSLSKVVLKADKLTLTQNASLANDTYVFVRNSTTGTYTAPQLGDVRVSYNALPVPFEGTLFGKLDGGTIDPYVSSKGDTLYRVFEGGHDESVAQLHSEYTTSLWIFRLVGFLMMWFGLTALFGPISIILDFLPVFGAISRALIGVITFAVALVLSAVTIVISAILHSLIAVIIVGVIALGAMIAGLMVWRKNKAKTSPASASSKM